MPVKIIFKKNTTAFCLTHIDESTFDKRLLPV